MFQQFRNLFIGKVHGVVFGVFGVSLVPTYKVIEYHNIEKIQETPSYFKNIWRIFLTERTCMTAIVADPTNFKDLPEDLRTKKLSKLAVEEEPSMFKFVPEIFRSQPMCELVVEHKPDMFFYVPEKKKTHAMCESVVKRDIDMYKYVPNEKKTENMSLEVFMKKHEMFYLIPKDNLTTSLCEKIIATDSNYFSSIPDIHKTKIMCESVIKEKPSYFPYVPDKFKTDTMCENVVKRDHRMFRHVPPEKKSEILIDYCAAQTRDLDVFRSTKMSGKKFNELFGNFAFVVLSKITKDENGNEIEIQVDGNYILKTGLNIDPQSISNVCQSTSKGELFFIEKDQYNNETKGIICRPVTIPDSAIVEIKNKYIKTTEMILGKRLVYSSNTYRSGTSFWWND